MRRSLASPRGAGSDGHRPRRFAASRRSRPPRGRATRARRCARTTRRRGRERAARRTRPSPRGSQLRRRRPPRETPGVVAIHPIRTLLTRILLRISRSKIARESRLPSRRRGRAVLRRGLGNEADAQTPRRLHEKVQIPGSRPLTRSHLGSFVAPNPYRPMSTSRTGRFRPRAGPLRSARNPVRLLLFPFVPRISPEPGLAFHPVRNGVRRRTERGASRPLGAGK